MMGWRFVSMLLLVPYLMMMGAGGHELSPLTVPPWARHQLDMPYSNLSPAQRLDLYWPSAGETDFPLVIAIHGGGFETGDKRTSELDPMIEALSHGYAVAAVNYRLSGEAKFPAAVVDIKAAIRYLRANAGSLHLDAKRFAVWGSSAGGNLAAMMAATSGRAVFDDHEFGNRDVSSDVQAAVDWYGPADFSTIDSQYGHQDRNKAIMDSFISLYLGPSTSLTPEVLRSAAIGTYVTPTIPPILIEHGDHDSTVPVDQSRDLAALVGQVAGPDRVQLVIIKGAEHADPVFRSQENLQRVFSFLEIRLH